MPKRLKYQYQEKIPVTFGNKVFNWKFRVTAETLICPMIIGINILHKTTITLEENVIKMDNEVVVDCV